MKPVTFPRAEVLKSLYDSFKAVLEMEIFITNRPKAVQEQMPYFGVIGLFSGITDRGDTYQESTGRISLFARDKANNRENTLVLDDMSAKVCSLFPIVTEKFSAIKPRLLHGGSDSLGFHYVSVQFSLIINK